MSEAEIDKAIDEEIAGGDEKDDDVSTWHEDPDPTHRGFDWPMLFIGLGLATLLAWGAMKQGELNRLNKEQSNGTYSCNTVPLP